MARPVFNSGHYTNASGLEFQQDVFETETRGRLLALVDTTGIVSGFGFSDLSVAGNPTIRVSRGIAYDGTGREVRLTQTQVLAGDSTLSGLTAADVNKIMVAQNMTTGVALEAHPLTGVETATKLLDVSQISLIASGSVDPVSHVRIGRISAVVEGSLADVSATTTNSRDVLSFPTSSPFLVVGPANDLVADFSGDDAVPFNDAIDQLNSASNGGVIVVRPGAYTINPETPIEINGLETVRVVGMGRGVVFSMNGPGSSPHWKIRNCQEVLIENIQISNTVHAAIEVMDTERFTIRGSRVVGSGSSYRGINFVSGITWAKVQDCSIAGDNAPQISFLAGTIGGVDNILIQDCHFESTNFYPNGEVTNFIFSDNLMDNASVLGVGRFFSVGASDFTSPKRGIVNGNIFESSSQVRCAASGIVISDNHFHIQGTVAAVDLETVNVHQANYCVVANNTITRTGTPAQLAIIQVATKGNVIKGNTLTFETVTTFGWAAIYLRSTSEANLVDSNIIAGNIDGGPLNILQDDGTTNWMGTTNNTSNKVLV